VSKQRKKVFPNIWKVGEKGDKINISRDCISNIWKVRVKEDKMMRKEEKCYIS